MAAIQLIPENPALPVVSVEEGVSIILGREPRHAGVVVVDEGISRAHVRIQCSGGRIYVSDLRSMNGSFIDGSKLQPDTSVELTAGRRLIVGSERVVYRLGNSSPGAGRQSMLVAGGSPGAVMGNTPMFVTLYILFMLPTYILPWVGSNATLLPALLGEVGAGKPYFWLHFLALVALVVIAWFRGVAKGKTWLILFPVAAAIFDLTPGLSWILFIPTLMHIMTLVFGIMDISIQAGSRK